MINKKKEKKKERIRRVKVFTAKTTTGMKYHRTEERRTIKQMVMESNKNEGEAVRNYRERGFLLPKKRILVYPFHVTIRYQKTIS